MHKLIRGDVDPTDVSSSVDVFPGDNGDKQPDKLTNLDKTEEDSYHQGNNGATGGSNSKQDYPSYSDKSGSVNMPQHVPTGEHAAGALTTKSKAGISTISLTIGTEEKAKRFTKLLFSKGLIASADFEGSGFEREYMMFGQRHSDISDFRLKMVTSDKRVPALIDFIN